MRLRPHERRRASHRAGSGSHCRAAGHRRRACPRPRRQPAARAGPSSGRCVLLLPYIGRYRGRALAALVALLTAALATLAVPLAVRRMIDFGFSHEGLNLIDSYFAVMIAVAGVLALASAARYYLVTTLGERIVADLRSEVFGHLTGLSVAFFDQAKTGEMMSRLTADTTQIKAAVGASVSVALRNLVLFFGAAGMMVVTSPRLSAVRARRHSGDRAAALRLRPRGAAALARGAGHARRRLRLCRRADRRGAHAAGLHQREARAAAASPPRSSAPSSPPCDSIRARAILTAIAIFLVFSSVVVVLWVGAQDVMAGDITPGRLSQFVLYAVFAASGLGQLSEVWGELSQASGAAERLFEILAVEPVIKAPARPVALPEPARGEVAFDDVRFAYPTRPDAAVLDGVSFQRAARREGRDRRPVGRRQEHDLPSDPALLRSGLGHHHASTACRSRDADPLALRRHIALVPQDAVVFAASVADNIRFGRPGRERRRGRAAPPSLRSRPNSSAACRKASTRRSASAASRSRAASASASRSRARSCATRRCCCSTRRRRRSMPRARRWCRPRSNG